LKILRFLKFWNYHENFNFHFGCTTSTDGITWEKQFLPININSSGKKLYYRDHYPNFINDDNEYKLYYSGYDYQNKLHLCFATSEKWFFNFISKRKFLKKNISFFYL